MERPSWMFGLAALCVAVVLGLGMAILYGGGPPPGPPRPRLPPAPAATGADLKFSATMFRALIESDAKAAGVPVPSSDEWRRPFPYADELPRSRRLRPGAPLRTAHLVLSLQVRREAGAVEGQAFRADHLILRIENATDRYLAYRVNTQVSDPVRCDAKGTIAHNALALRPHERIERTECLLQNAAELEITRVEIIELPALSYFYVSRLVPGSVLYDPRVAAGHTLPAHAAPCQQTFSWREIEEGAARGRIAWRDIIDFHARHSCDEFGFFPGYRYREQPDAPLPVRRPDSPTH